MDKPKILLVEDEPHLARVIKDSLEQQGYGVTHAMDGKVGYNLFLNDRYALCILDVMLPHMDGYTLAKQIRIHAIDVPLLFLSARIATADVIAGYDSGGNDYLKKPFSLEELFFRVRELLRRRDFTLTDLAGDIPIGQYNFNLKRQTLQYLQEPMVKLSHRETQLLQMLCAHKNMLLDRRGVLLSLWGDDSYFHTRTMDVFITKLRKHLSKDPSVEILNIRGHGFKLLC